MTLQVFTLAHGRDDVRAQALYSAWSTLAWAGELPLALHVYTDAPELFAPLGPAVTTRRVDAEEIRAWRGPHDFVFRTKPLLFADMVARFPAEPILYLDADTFFVAPVATVAARISAASSVMHLRERNVATDPGSQMRKFRRDVSRVMVRGKPADISCDMWNAGVIGMDPTRFGLVPDWLELVDALYPATRRWVVEQYGIALLLQRAGQLQACDDAIFHYWFQKGGYTAAIERELAVLRTLPPAEALARVRAGRLALPYVREKPRRTLRDRLRRVLFGRVP